MDEETDEEIRGKWNTSVMLLPRIHSVRLHSCPGSGGEALQRVNSVLEELSNQKPIVHKAKKTIRNFGIKKGEPIAVSVTLRGQKAMEVLDRVAEAVDRKIKASSFDRLGNFSFGIKEHIDIPEVKYRAEIGIIGMDVNVSLERKGYRIGRRRIARNKLPRRQMLTTSEGILFAKEYLNLQVTTE